MLNLKQHELTHSHRNVCCECCSVYICMGVWVCGCPCVSTSHLKGAKIWQQAAHTHHPRPYSITHFQQRPLPAPPCPFGLTNSVQISTEKLERVAAGRSCLKSFLNITARSEGRGSGVARLGGWGYEVSGSRALGLWESEMFVCSPHFFCTYAHIANSLGFTWLFCFVVPPTAFFMTERPEQQLIALLSFKVLSFDIPLGLCTQGIDNKESIYHFHTSVSSQLPQICTSKSPTETL